MEAVDEGGEFPSQGIADKETVGTLGRGSVGYLDTGRRGFVGKRDSATADKRA
jgi:hypothetical protein